MMGRVITAAAVVVAVLLPARARRPATEITEPAESEAVIA